MKKLMICMLMLFTMCPIGYAEPNQTNNNEGTYGFTPLKLTKPLLPTAPRDWKLVIKTFENCFLLIYLDQNDGFITSISEYSRRPITPLNETKHTLFNNTTYYYDPWQSNQRGWMLRWVKGDVYFEMNSFTLNVDEMITIAETITEQIKE
ncbi:hypothetical protein [Paenibacillus sp. Cedars]|uniref:hypothetical protein n=1 Tax=Paenibacillus sp. Cedars TaxID=1980674 RepID=UPI0011648BFC|nr:hypothetical protein [Paenibacillus sp. Cedars]AWP25418.1 hypothetical protein B9D94_01630 [Paenibacillus sp. Cedars]